MNGASSSMSNDPTATWAVVWRARVWIVASAVLVAAAAYGVASLQPKIYGARATVLTPKESGQQSLSLSLGSFLGTGSGREGSGGGMSLPALLGGSPASLSTNQDMFVVLLRSRTLREQVIASMKKKYGARVDGVLVGVLPDTKDKGAIALNVEAKNPELAAEFANEYFEELDRMLERYAEQNTKRQEASYAAQLQRAAREVEISEDALVKFQNENRMLGGGVDSTTKKDVDVGASMRGQIMALELQREVMAMRYTPQHPTMREIEKQIAELKRQYSKNLFGAPMDLPGDPAGGKGARKEFFVPAEKMTPMQLNYLKLYRNLRIQEAFYTGALQGLQQIQYNNAAPQNRVEFLDRALPNPGAIRPNVRFIAAGSGLVALVVASLLALVLEFFRQRRLALAAATPASRRSAVAAEPAEPLVPAR